MHLLLVFGISLKLYCFLDWLYVSVLLWKFNSNTLSSTSGDSFVCQLVCFLSAAYLSLPLFLLLFSPSFFTLSLLTLSFFPLFLYTLFLFSLSLFTLARITSVTLYSARTIGNHKVIPSSKQRGVRYFLVSYNHH